jgi:hypothetical protein
VGEGVGPPLGRTGGLEPIEPGVGVGPWATSGPLAVGLADGSLDGDGSTDGNGSGETRAPDADGTGVDAPEPGEDGVVAVGCDELPVVAELGVMLGPSATRDGGPGGVSRPAASATVARMRFRSPKATTRRARWAEVTTTDGLLPTGRHGVRRDDPMVAPGSAGPFDLARKRAPVVPTAPAAASAEGGC